MPDHSVVILNGNSSIRYSSDWNADKPRMVQLEGEGFFNVVHTENHQKFIVQTGDDVKVEVLGTTFNVLQRESRTQVVLNTGKVKLNLGEKQNIMMQPGELVEVKDQTNLVVRKTVNPEIYSSWTTKRLVLDNTSLQEISVMLKETYGLNVEVPDKKLLLLKSSGSMPTGDVDFLLEVIAETFNLKVKRKGKDVFFQSQ